MDNAKSTVSASSTASSALQLKAKAAALRVQAKAIKRRHILEDEEQKIRRQMEEYQLNTHIRHTNFSILEKC